MAEPGDIGPLRPGGPTLPPIRQPHRERRRKQREQEPESRHKDREPPQDGEPHIDEYA